MSASSGRVQYSPGEENGPGLDVADQEDEGTVERQLDIRRRGTCDAYNHPGGSGGLGPSSSTDTKALCRTSWIYRPRSPFMPEKSCCVGERARHAKLSEGIPEAAVLDCNTSPRRASLSCNAGRRSVQ